MAGTRLKRTYQCQKCGVDYRPFVREQKFCSWACLNLARFRQPRACETCGKEFLPGKNTQRYCSRACAGVFFRNAAYLRGENHYNYKGRWQKGSGYIQVSINSLSPEERSLFIEPSRKLSTIQEHRLVMMRALGRRLRAEEVVHHKNRNKTDNRLENLEVWVKSHPNGGRARDLICPHCGKHYA